MLKNQVEKYLATQDGTVELHNVVKDYAERQGLLEGTEAKVLDSGTLFASAYIERGDKETEEFLGQESSDFLEQPISYFKDRKNEFMYMESNWFDLIGVDAVSFEKDDVFGTYDVMLGLKLQKKMEPAIKNYLEQHLQDSGYDLMFDGNEGLWSLNFALNGLEGYKESLSIKDAFSLIYDFLFRMAESIENK
ncbi:branched-chain amino acid aminotransferase [Bacillus sp. ISL-35]|uniref:hypothetical protein n=1 Tax=Bacillus sp. ISL-35 TaxID=2819122 RepID=UPI001BE6FADA|nr:hypothetical protein [Bacillus sp. ISL-35]MBT2681084.1 branched-chain amino acid aminotransferase [Bacillus sp. ISL-35]MBT2705403.1 hypothetical protein [Chryseobacterium sp. ISL-80]